MDVLSCVPTMANPILDPNAPEFTRRCTNLADPRLGAQVVSCSDEFFAPRERLLAPTEPVFVAGKYDDHGKWMDGWETRRKRGPGHDWCVVRLARPGRIFGVDIDTRHFTGNYPPAASLEVCRSTHEVPDGTAHWAPLLPTVALGGTLLFALARCGLLLALDLGVGAGEVLIGQLLGGVDVEAGIE